jgi:cysteine-rich repeat protein
MRRVVFPVLMGLLLVSWSACDSGKKFTPDDGDELDQAADDTAEGTDPAEVIPDVPTEDMIPDTPVDVIPDTIDDEPCVSTCGNGVVECDEECDDGNTVPGDGCSDTCTVDSTTHCGDGNVDYADGEECDDGNTDPGDGCSPTCRLEAPATCGDGNLDIDRGEECDDGNRTGGD